ncbi:PHD finger protein male meiocyte death 1-like [Trifolium pratense]|uniref:PHD finger protein male meiocyte death 1-like n=1 Tax=Trifolium pratense TaxID=57577 RepID=A0A2K3MYQ6_TRIPR|nr:PHD finger protein male meiocyte death 1-like [Trifolium pratense]
MSFSTIDVCKKRKRWPKIFRLQSFADPGCPIAPSGSFRENVRLFLQEAGELEDYTVMGNPLWCTFLNHEKSNLMVPFYTLEEQVYNSSHPFCDHCRCVGWSGHFVSKRRYHFIIPMDNEWHKPLNEEALDNQNHLLHGVIHCNGYGHLICLNGIEGGSKFLSGREIMELWDRICTNLRARQIAVEDASRKRSMDLRLLHGVAYGHSWFGRWGYKFCRGSFGVTEENYYEAIETLGSLVLDDIVRDLSKTKYHKDIKQMIRFYRDMSETRIVTIRELLRFMLTVKSRHTVSKITVTYSSSDAASAADSPPCSTSACMSRNSTKHALSSRSNSMNKEKSARYKKFSTAVATMDSRWPTRRLEFAAQVIVDALKEDKAMKPGSSGMTRQDVRDAARVHIGDTGLLDYVLKSLNNVIVENYVVRRMVNPSSRILEYTIHELGKEFKAPEVEYSVMTLVDNPQVESSTPSSSSSLSLVPGNDVYSDVVYLYKNVLLGYPDSEPVELAVQTILHCRHFVKEWKLRDEMEQVLTFICRLKPNFIENKSDFKGPSCGEIVTVPLHATVKDLKQAAEAALRDTYCIAERLIVTDIKELMDADDEEVIFGQIESGVKLCVRGIGIDLYTPLKYQGGSDNWKVRCECGAQDDDGERMIACDICEVWQHTRCCGIDDSETVPPLFVCSGCCDSLVPPRIESSRYGMVDCADAFLVSAEAAHLLEYGYGY